MIDRFEGADYPRQIARRKRGLTMRRAVYAGLFLGMAGAMAALVILPTFMSPRGGMTAQRTQNLIR